MERNILDMLPEILHNIFNFLHRTELIEFACTCKTAYELTKYKLFAHVRLHPTNVNDQDMFKRILKNIQFATTLYLDGWKDVNNLPNLLAVLHNCRSHILTKISIRYSFITQEFMQCICELSLQNLDLSYCENLDADSTCMHLSSLKSLMKLDVSSTGISQDGVLRVCDLKSLVELNLGGCAVHDNSLVSLPLLKVLKKLDVRCTYITQVGLSLICQITSLQELDVCGCQDVGGESFMYLSSLKALKKLDVRGTAITQVAVAVICQLTSLEDLRLGGCRYVDDDSLKNLSSLMVLKTLDMSRSSISRIGVAHICKVSSLEDLNLSDCFNIEDNNLRNLSSLKSLKKLRLMRCNVGDDSAQYLVSLKSLKLLNMSFTRITSHGLSHISKVRSLEDLDLAWCPSIGNDSIPHLLSMKSLKKLDVTHTSITQEGSASLKDNIKFVQCSSN